MVSAMRSISDLIFDVCDTILRRAEDVDVEGIRTYISTLENDEIKLLNKQNETTKRKNIHSIVQMKLFQYIDTYKDDKSGNSPFDFDIGNNYQIYVDEFISIYKEYNNSAQPPKIFSYIFEYIKDASEHYRIFEKFYIIREDDVETRVDKIIQKAAKEAAREAAREAAKEAAREAAKEATKEATCSASFAASMANRAAEDAENASQVAAEDAVNKKMHDVTKNVSETSVTILGMFTGIVLAVVAGLFYSSSVLESVNSANFYRLISVASLVGFVCYSLIALMFRYIERIKYADRDKHPRFSKLTIVISCVLLTIMVVAGVLQYVMPEKTDKNIGNESVVDVNITTQTNDKSKNDDATNNVSDNSVDTNKETHQN